MIVQVLQKHIDAGDRGREESCPIALAIREQLPGKRVQVGSASCIIINVFIYKTAPAFFEQVDQFINEFDAGALVEPIEFELSE